MIERARAAAGGAAFATVAVLAAACAPPLARVRVVGWSEAGDVVNVEVEAESTRDVAVSLCVHVVVQQKMSRHPEGETVEEIAIGEFPLDLGPSETRRSSHQLPIRSLDLRHLLTVAHPTAVRAFAASAATCAPPGAGPPSP